MDPVLVGGFGAAIASGHPRLDDAEIGVRRVVKEAIVPNCGYSYSPKTGTCARASVASYACRNGLAAPQVTAWPIRSEWMDPRRR